MLFVLALFFAPLAGSVPAFATAPALTEIDWEDATEYGPAVLTAIAMPFTYSIAEGIGGGFIAYTVIKISSGRVREVSPINAILAVLFVLKYEFV